MKNLKNLAILGNVVFIVWITYNGIGESFRGTIVQKVSYLGITAVLLLNIFLLSRKK